MYFFSNIKYLSISEYLKKIKQIIFCNNDQFLRAHDNLILWLDQAMVLVEKRFAYQRFKFPHFPNCTIEIDPDHPASSDGKHATFHHAHIHFRHAIFAINTFWAIRRWELSVILRTIMEGFFFCPRREIVVRTRFIGDVIIPTIAYINVRFFF